MAQHYPIAGCHALITGASSGLGTEFARQLATRAQSLILVARRKQRLEQLAKELQGRFPKLRVHTLQADLSNQAERQQLIQTIRDQDWPISLLINNAGLGDYGEFASSDWDKNQAMLQVNIEALTHLSHALIPTLKTHRGAILNVSSLASAVPLPDFAVYAATKAYVTAFSEALAIELAPHNIPVTALKPGPIKTEFGQIANREDSGKLFPSSMQRFMQIPPQECVREALHALEQRKPSIFPGLAVAATAAFLTLTPILLLRPILKTRPRQS